MGKLAFRFFWATIGISFKMLWGLILILLLIGMMLIEYMLRGLLVAILVFTLWNLCTLITGWPTLSPLQALALGGLYGFLKQKFGEAK